VDDDAAIDAFRAARVARLATVGPSGPHLVPIVFAVVGEAVCTAVDGKPKTTPDLRRLRNIRADPRVTVLVDHYADDWSLLWWVRLDGRARVVDAAEPGGLAAIEALTGKYEQYRSTPPPGPVILIQPQRWSHWSPRSKPTGRG
jgi:PPOX class probable F420-dependent enzyme